MICNSERMVLRGKYINKQKHVREDSNEESRNKLVQRIRLFFIIFCTRKNQSMVGIADCIYHGKKNHTKMRIGGGSLEDVCLDENSQNTHTVFTHREGKRISVRNTCSVFKYFEIVRAFIVFKTTRQSIQHTVIDSPLLIKSSPNKFQPSNQLKNDSNPKLSYQNPHH